MRPGEHLSRRVFLIGACVAVAIGLGATAWGVFSPAVLAHYSDSPDSVDIARCAERAGRTQMLRWLSGQWIQNSSPPYYRPLASYLFWAECILFGRNFQGHVVLSWLIHGAISLCVYVLALRLLPGGRPGALAFSLLAVVLFNVRLGPESPFWRPQPVAYGVVAWWPSQTDQMSLLPSLLALLALDRWLVERRRGGLALAAALWLVALLFKEMAITLPAVAMLLVIYRGGLASLTFGKPTAAEGEEVAPRGLAWLVGGAGFAAAVGYMALRSAFVGGRPRAADEGLEFYLNKVMHMLFYRPYAVTSARGAWLIVAAVLCAVVIMLWIRAKRRPSPVWLILAMLLAVGLPAQLMAHNFFLVTIPREIAALFTMTTLALGLLVLAQVRELWPWLLLAMTLVVHIPLLWVWGPHYFYWPAAFWGLFNAGLWHYAWGKWLWQPGQVLQHEGAQLAAPAGGQP